MSSTHPLGMGIYLINPKCDDGRKVFMNESHEDGTKSEASRDDKLEFWCVHKEHLLLKFYC